MVYIGTYSKRSMKFIKQKVCDVTLLSGFKLFLQLGNFPVNLRKNELDTWLTGPHFFKNVFRAVKITMKLQKNSNLSSTSATFKMSSLKFIYFTIRQEIKEH